VTKLVTVAIPVYKRFDFLPKAIQSVALQDYPNIELIVSDNGMNGARVPEIVRQNYPHPFRFRQEPVTVPLVAHFNHLLQEASGNYYVQLCDDDEISPSFASELVGILEDDPRVSVAFARQEVVDFSGCIIRTSSGQIPERMTGEEFVQAWCTYQYGFKSWVTFLGRTKEIRDCGGMLESPYGTHADDSLVLKLCLGNLVAFSQRCAFRNRAYEESSGYSCSWRDLAEDTELFLRFLDSDPTICKFASAEKERWTESKKLMVKMTWETYHGRWATVYRKRLSWYSWLRAAFAMPFIPAYYHAVLRTLVGGLRTAVSEPVKKFLPGTRRMFRTLKDDKSV
jgi:glycosyltransferase involved in cell wall biosynthesis